MAEQSFLAKLGLRTGVLGSLANLAIALPLANGDYGPAAHTDASRIGFFGDRTGGAEKMSTVVMGVEALRVRGTGVDALVRLNTIASAAVVGAGFNLPHGVAPNAPVDGDLWTTTGGAFVRINGVTQGFVTGAAGADTEIQFNNSGAFGASSNLAWLAGTTLSVQTAGDTTALLLTCPAVVANPAISLAQLPLSTDLATGKVLQAAVAGETFGRVLLYSDGKYAVGGGTLTRDTVLSRSAAATWRMSGDGGTAACHLEVWGRVAVGGQAVSTSTELLLPAATTLSSSLRIPHGAAPTAPVDGDAWTTTSNLFVRINGVTQTMLQGVGTATQYAYYSAAGTLTSVANLTLVGGRVLIGLAATDNTITVIGDSAGTAAMGANTLCIGNSAGAALLAGGDSNTLLGHRAGVALTAGSRNVVVGSAPVTGNISDSVVIGASATAGSSSGVVLIGSTASGTGTRNTTIGYSAKSGGGADNTVIGNGAAPNITSSAQNVIIGANTALGLTGNWRNVIIGDGINSGNTQFAVVIGSGAVTATSTGVVVIGNGARGDSGSGFSVTIGYLAGNASNTSGSIIVGANAKAGSGSGVSSVVIGYNAGSAASGGAYNTIAIGESALTSVTGSSNVAIGYQAGVYTTALTTGTSNTLVGSQAQVAAAASDSGVGVGHRALIGTNAVAIGHSAVAAVTGGVAVGQAAKTGASGTASIAIGYLAGNAALGAANVVLGNSAGALLTGGNNVFVGAGAGTTPITAANNVVIGAAATTGSTASSAVVAIGFAATATNNGVAVGSQSVAAGQYTVAIGELATASASSGTIAIGRSAKSGGNSSMAIGYNAGNASLGTFSIAIGEEAGLNSTGTKNMFFGYQAGVAGTAIVAGSSNIMIGYQAQGNGASVSGAIIIGHGSIGGDASVVIGGTSTASSSNVSVAIKGVAGSNQIVFGSNSATGQFNELVIGRGQQQDTTNVVTIRNTNGAGTDISGSDLKIQAGRSTGAGLGGIVRLQSSLSAVSSTTLNAAVDLITCDPINGTTIRGVTAVAGAAVSASTALNLPASTTTVGSLRLAHGVAPTAPVNGDIWTTTSGVYAYINGATIGALAAVAGADTQVQFNDGGVMGAAATLLFDKTLKQLGIGTSATPAAAQGALYTRNTYTGTTDFNGNYFVQTLTPASAVVSGRMRGVYVNVAGSGAFFNSNTIVRGVQTDVAITATVAAALDTVLGNIVDVTFTNGAASTVATSVSALTGVSVTTRATASALGGYQSIGSMVGVDISGQASKAGTGTVDIFNYIGLRINALSGLGSGVTCTNNYGVYQGDTSALNYFGGFGSFGATPSASNYLTLGASSTAIAHMRFGTAGAAPTSPVTGDLWVLNASGISFNTTALGVRTCVTATAASPLAATQVAVGSAANTVAGSANFTVVASGGGQTYGITCGSITTDNPNGIATTLTSLSATPSTYAQGYVLAVNGAPSVSAANMTYIGQSVATHADTANSPNATTIGVQSSVTASPTGVVSGNLAKLMVGVSAVVQSTAVNASAAVAVTDAYAFRASGVAFTGSVTGLMTVTNYYGLHLAAPALTNAAITNNYGVFQADATALNSFAGVVLTGTFFRNTPQSVSATAGITSGRVKFTGSTAGQTLTLPAGISGTDVFVRNASSVAVTVAASGSDTIEGGASYILNPGNALSLNCVGTDWTAF